MDNHFYDNDFERFLQDQTKQHRLYASDAVWKGIYKQLHGHRTWPGLNFFAIVIVAALTILTVIADKHSFDQAEKKSNTVKQDVAFTSIADHLDPAKATQRTFELIERRKEELNEDVADVTPNAAIPTVSADDQLASLDNEVNISTKPELKSIASLTAINNDAVEELLVAKINTEEQPKIEVASKEEASLEKKEDETIAEVKKEDDKLSSLDKYLQEQADELIRLNKKSAARQPKWGLQFYITPSVSFRELTNDKTIADNNNSVAPVAPNAAVTDVNEIVKHRPGMGTEMGLSVTYNLTNRLKIKAGGQLNIRQYNIEAYRGATEQTAIAMVRDGQVDTFTTYAMYRSKEGYTPTVLTNKYYQLSMPVGVEFSLLSNKAFGLSVGTTLQPTYTITPNTSYFITTDYNSYADGSMFLRRWNVNSSFETILSYKVGNVQWRLAPQVRYQLLSTYSTPYPIKEHLIDYGIKIGFAKSL